jgi:outer membrane beta-barrel protein
VHSAACRSVEWGEDTGSQVLGRRNLLLVVAAAVIASASPLAAQTLIEGEIVVVQPKKVLVQQRVEVLPRFGVTFNDTLITQFSLGGSLYYHISENLYVGATFEWFDFDGIGGTTDTYDEVIRTTTTLPELAPVTWVASAELGWTPIHGKFSLFDVVIVHYDIYGLLGVGAIETVGDPTVAGVIALGQRTFIGDWLALTIEVRDRAYVEPLPLSGDTFTNVLTASIGLGFFIPPSFRHAESEERILDWE